MNVPQALQRLHSEKEWFDEVIASIEQLQRSKPFQAVATLDRHLAQDGRFDRGGLSPRSRRRVSRWLREK